MAVTQNDIIRKIRDNVVGDNTTGDVNALFDLVLNTTNPALAAQDLLIYISNEPDPAYARADVSTQLISIATDLPFAHVQLSQVIASLVEKDDGIRKSLESNIGDLVPSEMAGLRDDQEPEKVASYVSLHGFLSRLLSLGLSSSSNRVTGLDDALFIIAEGLESEKPLGVDVAAAAQYFIHAAQTMRKACLGHTGQDKAANSPVWQSRGPLWTTEHLAYNEQRWEFWRKQFTELEKEESLDEAVRKIAGLAKRTMDLET